MKVLVLKSKEAAWAIPPTLIKAPRVACERLYKLTVLPHLDYCMCLGSPPSKVQGNIELCTSFASKVVLQNWTAPQQQKLSILKWPCLDNRRQVQKLIMCRKIVNGQSCIPPSAFTPHPYPSLRHSDSLPLLVPQTHSVSHRSSVFVSVVSLWNSLPSTIPLTSSATFKTHMVAYEI